MKAIELLNKRTDEPPNPWKKNPDPLVIDKKKKTTKNNPAI